MKLDSLNKKHIMGLADSAGVYQRGEDYFLRDLVADIKYTAGRLSARVEGSRVYRVEIREKKDGLDCYCDCPYDGEVCKHIVAVLLEYLENKEELASGAERDRDDLEKIRKMLHQLPQEKLVDLVMELMNTGCFDNPRILVLDRLGESLEGEMQKEDVYYHKFKALWEKADRVIKDMCDYGFEDDDLDYEVSEILEQITTIFKEGRLNPQLRKEYLDNLFYYYDSDNSGIEDVLMDNIFEVADSDDDWHYIIEKLKSGSQDSDGYRKHLIMSIYRSKLHDDESYLKERLARLKYGSNYYDLVTYYDQKGEMNEAVRLAEEGMVKGEGRIADLIDFLKVYYKNKKDYENSVRLYRLAFNHSPGLHTYRELKSLCRKRDWPEIERECLDKLSRDRRERELARIHLHEGHHDLVLRYVLSGEGRYALDDKDELADAISGHYPDEIADYYKSKVERSIGEKTRQGYQRAVSYARKVRSLYQKMDRNLDFEMYINQIRMGNARRPALLEELRKL